MQSRVYAAIFEVPYVLQPDTGIGWRFVCGRHPVPPKTDFLVDLPCAWYQPILGIVADDI